MVHVHASPDNRRYFESMAPRAAIGAYAFFPALAPNPLPSPLLLGILDNDNDPDPACSLQFAVWFIIIIHKP